MLSFKNRQDIFRISTWVIILGGLMLTAIAFAVVRNWERQERRTDFSIAVENRYAALEREVKSGIEVLSSIRAFYLHAKVVTRSEFHNFTESLLLQHHGIQALEWIPRVPYSQREEYEKAAQRDGFKDFQITEQSARDKIAKAGKRSEYFPVYFVEPYNGNESALGYDLASDPLRRETLDRSRDTGGIAATAKIKLIQEEKGQSGLLVIYPVYQRNMPVDSTQNRKDNIRGFAAGVFLIGDVVENALTYLKPGGIDIYLHDNSALGKERFLYFHPSRTRKTTDLLRNEGPVPDGGLKITRTLKIADREWQILFVATPDYVASGHTWQPWGVLLAGLLLTGLLAGFLIVEARRAEELTASNELLLQEIAGRRKTEEELRLSEERFRRIFDEGHFGMILANPDYTIVMANKAFCGLLGYSEQELAGQSIADITCEEDREKGREFSGQLFAGSISVLRLEKRYVRKDGGIVWTNLTVSAIHGKEGNVIYGLSLIEDLTDSKKAEEKIHLLHYYDSLTGLPNRIFHKELMKRAIEHAQRHKEIFAIIYIGLDNFQRINDTLGYNIGDLLLKAVADRLAHSLRKSDAVARSNEGETENIVSRVGGDEFIILAHDLNHAQDAAIASRRLLEEISIPYDLSGREVFMTASIGISLYPDDGTDVDDLLKNAEKAMRCTKSEGKNNYQFYSGLMNSFVLELLTLESDLHKALERNELVLYYQPKVDAATRRVKGMEALIRWKHPDKGLIPPTQFIPLAETSGLILPIGEFVIRTVCRQIRTWQEAGYQHVNIALNVSGRQFDQGSLIEIVKEALQDAMIPPQCLELEITESIIMRNPEKAIRTLTELKAMGIQIAIDDFGTGYSSLSYLKRLPLDFLKIDQSFVQNLASDPSDQAIVRATIAMARSLNLKTIAEGVETEEQLSFLQKHGCDEIQGYLFSRPLSAEEIPGILAKGDL